MKKSHRIIGLVTVAALAALVTLGAVEYDWFPTLVSPSSEKIDSLYKWLLVASVPFFVIIVAAIAFMLIEFRAKGEQDDRDGVPIHGSTLLEVVWTTIPTVIVVALGFYAWGVLNDVEAKQRNELTVRVIGQQFLWTFEYLDENDEVVAKSNDLVVPAGRPLHFLIEARDVVHSFYVPNARLKRDATPGVVKSLRFRPTKLGAYPIVCAELCGIGHATMRSTMFVVKRPAFAKWLKDGGGVYTMTEAKGGDKAAGGTGGGDAAAGKTVFTSNCGSCHKLADAGTAGAVGPALDGIGKESEATLLEMIAEPDKDVAKGYSKGIMPPTFGDSIPKEDLDALVAYLQQAAK